MKNNRFKKIISNRITELRTAANLTGERLAYESGLSKGGLSEVERSIKEPTILTVAKICAGLGITLKEFFDFEDIDNFVENL